MYKYGIKLTHNKQKCEYTCSKHIQSEHTDREKLKFTQICSVRPLRSTECVPDVELFLESAHMNMNIAERPIGASCDTCHRAIQNRLCALRHYDLSELWRYSDILYGPEESVFERLYIHELSDAAVRLPSWSCVQSVLPQQSTHTKAKPRNIKKAADKYASAHGGFTLQEFEEHNLALYQDNMGLCSAQLSASTQPYKGTHTIVQAINHYADDFRYIRIFREPLRDVCIALFNNRKICKKLHSHPALTFAEATRVSYEMAHNDTLMSHDITVNDTLIASGLRSSFGITNIHTTIIGRRLRISEEIRGDNMKQCGILRLFNGNVAVDRVYNIILPDTNYISHDTISSLHDFRLTITKIMRIALSQCVFVRDVCTVMLEVDLRNKRTFNPQKEHDKHNIEIKRRIKKWSDSAFRSAGIIVDLSKEMSLGDSFSCGNLHCTNKDHKHKTVVYIDENSPRFIEHIHNYLHNIRYVANVCTMLSEHVKHGYMHIVYVLQQKDIVNIRRNSERTILDIEREYTRIVQAHKNIYNLNVIPYLSSNAYVGLLQAIRERKYDFLQLHGIQKFSFDIFTQIKDKYNESKTQFSADREHEYLFYIGNIDVQMTNTCTRPHHYITTYMIRIVESNVRFKSEVLLNDRARKHTCAELIKEAVVSHMQYREIHKKQKNKATVPLTVLSGYMHLQYSSIGATFSFVDDMPLRIYRARDVQIPYTHNADYIYYRAHSFAVTITGACINILKSVGRHLEKTHTCSCKSRSVKCDKCLHNVIFCERDTVVSDYISAKFEEIIPLIAAMYVSYSFNGANTQRHELDRKIFPQHTNMFKCGHSVEFLYHPDAAKITEVQNELKNSEHISIAFMHKIMEDEGFCLVLVEPINETYGEIKTSREDLYNAVLQLYYNDELRQQIMIPFFVENTFRTLWMNACVHTLLNFEKYIKDRMLRAQEEQSHKDDTHNTHQKTISADISARDLRRYRESVKDKDLVAYNDILPGTVEDAIMNLTHTNIMYKTTTTVMPL